MPCNCNTPTNTPYGCQPCDDSNPGCSCPIKDLSTDCVLYTGDDLPCSGIVKDSVLTDLIQRLDEFICEVRDDILSYVAQVTTLINIGGGAEVYKQPNGLGNKELRTIVSEDDSLLDIVENADTIGIRAGTPSIELDSDTDILSLIITTLSGAITLSDVDLSEYNYDTFVQGVTFNDTTEILTITRNNGEPNIDVDLSYLNNNLESVSFNSITNDIEFTLTNSTTLTLNTSTFLNSTTLPNSTETEQGIIEIATQAEVDLGVDTERAVTPATLSTNITDILSNPINLPNSTEVQRGIAEIATQAEVDLGNDDEKFVTPLKLETRLNSVLQTTIINLSTWTSNTITTNINHGIGSVPITTFIQLICTVANNGYSDGDVVRVASRVQDRDESGSGGDTFRRGITAIFNNSNSNNFDLNVGAHIDIPSASSGEEIIPSPTQWDIQIVFLHL